MLDVAVDNGVIEKSGTWYIYKGIKIGQGRESAINYLTENPQTAQEIDKKTRENYFLKESGAVKPADEPDDPGEMPEEDADAVESALETPKEAVKEEAKETVKETAKKASKKK